MALRLTHETLTSFAVSAMLTSAFLAASPTIAIEASAGPQPQIIMNALSSMHASGWAGTQEMMPPVDVAVSQSASAEPTSAGKPILSADQQKKLLALMAAHGQDEPLDPAGTAALGISKGNEVLTLRQLGVNTPLGVHGYIPLPDGGLMLGFSDETASSNYRLDANLRLIAAISMSTKQAPIAIPMPDAERNVQTELTFWAALADRH